MKTQLLVQSIFKSLLASSSHLSTDIFDTVATSHMSPHGNMFRNKKSIEPHPIAVAAQAIDIWATHIGSVSIGRLKLDHVLYCKELTGTLITIGHFCDAGYQAIITDKQGFIIDENDQIVSRMIHNPTSD